MQRNIFYRQLKRGYYALRRPLSHWKNDLFDQNPKLIILTYHRVLPKVDFNPLGTIIALDIFIKQIEFLAKKFKIISLEDAFNQCALGLAKKKNQVVLTFDDGYKDNYDYVLPFLKNKGLPAVFFLTTDYIGSNKPVWDWQFARIISSLSVIPRIAGIGGISVVKGVYESRISFLLRVINKMKNLKAADRQEIINFLMSYSDKKGILLNNYRNDFCLNWAEVKTIKESGMEIGSHGLSHMSLSAMPLSQAQVEIEGSKSKIEQELSSSCCYFAFPFGSQSDYNSELVKYAQSKNFRFCFSNTHGYNHIKNDAFFLKRIIMSEYSPLKYLFG